MATNENALSSPSGLIAFTVHQPIPSGYLNSVNTCITTLDTAKHNRGTALLAADELHYGKFTATDSFSVSHPTSTSTVIINSIAGQVSSLDLTKDGAVRGAIQVDSLGDSTNWASYAAFTGSFIDFPISVANTSGGAITLVRPLSGSSASFTGNLAAGSFDAATLNLGTSLASTINMGTAAGTQIINIGTGSGVTSINLGGAGDTVNVAGTLTYINTTNLTVTDKLITLNKGGLVSSGDACGLEVEENNLPEGFLKVGNVRNSWLLKAPGRPGTFSFTPGDSAFNSEIRSTATAARSFTLPDTSGTLALTSDIASAVGGLSLNGINDVTIASPATGELLMKSSGDWVNANISEIPLTGYSVGSNTLLAATDTFGSAFGKLQGQITARMTSVSVTAPLVRSVSAGEAAGGSYLTYSLSMPAATVAGAGHMTATQVTDLSNCVSKLAGISAGASVSTVTGTAPISVVNNTTTPAISIAKATSTTAGYLSAADWNTFNNKQNALGGNSYVPIDANSRADLPANGLRFGVAGSYYSLNIVNGILIQTAL